MTENYTHILEKLPYSEPFLFVDALSQLDENGAVGTYRFPEDSFFYKGHFKHRPVTPGVILTECAAQIGLVCLGIYLHQAKTENAPADSSDSTLAVALTGTEMDFRKPVFPGETVRVVSEKLFFRFQKLKCKVLVYNEKEEVVCRGTLSGMLTKTL